MTPTPRALELREETRELVRRGTAVLTPPRTLDLDTLDRAFTIRGHDALASALALPLTTAIAQAAPHIKIRFLAEPAADVSDLARGHTDLEVGAKGKPVTTRPRKPSRRSLPPIDRLVIAPFSPARKRARRAPTEAVPLEPLDQIYQALVLGVRDYVRKNGFESVVIGLSGGIDSALTAVIAVDALGADHVLGLFMPSPYTSPESREDVSDLALRLKITVQTIPIARTLTSYLAALAKSFKGRAGDTTEENLQARIRGNLLMALSNKFGHLVLTTGNKSEMSVGYATLYGDMAGGFAVIKDVPKTMVYELAYLRNAAGRAPVIPERTLTRPPSAELKPHQVDQDTLPPYDVLDRILKAYIEEVKSPQEIAIETGFDLQLVRDISALVDRNEYKRKQAAPGLKITSRAFGFGRPFPIAQRFIP